MTKFIPPRNKYSYEELGLEACVKALIDADVNYDDVDRAVTGFVYGDSCCGQRVVYQLGLTGIPVYNVNNNCSTGSTALYMAREFVESGHAQVALAVGFEIMERGSLGVKYTDRTNPLDRLTHSMAIHAGVNVKSSVACQFFANAGEEYIQKYGNGSQEDKDVMARIAQINHAHSVNNPYSQFQDTYTLEEIKASKSVHRSVTKLQCCPTSDGAAAAVLVSQAYLDKHPELRDQAVEILAQEMGTDRATLFSGSSMDLIGREMTETAAASLYSRTGLTGKDIQVVELHDCFSANELCVLDSAGLSGKGQAVNLVKRGGITYGPNLEVLVNPSGGLISKGHPLGATGLAQLAELVWHLRGWATNRTVPNTRHCLQHNLGLGGCVVMGIYRRADGQVAPSAAELDAPHRKADGRARLGYNPALEARPITKAQLESVVSRKQSDRFTYEGNRLAGTEGASL